jgi:GNAT superfamily N-acetyltransferase
MKQGVSKNQAKISIEQLNVRAFGSDVNFSAFDCGRRSINAFLKNVASKVSKRGEYTVFTVHEKSEKILLPSVLGYYALQVSTDSADSLSEKKTSYLKHYSYFPAIELSYIGVHGECQRQGVGQFLLMDVFRRVSIVSEHVGFYALLLTALDAEAKNFYLSLGFHEYPDSTGMRMMLTLREILDLRAKVEEMARHN